MYRQYENPRTLERQLEDAERRLSDARAKGAELEELMDLQNEVDDLKERANFAWQDEEEDW